jgi:hypothetical protein
MSGKRSEIAHAEHLNWEESYLDSQHLIMWACLWLFSQKFFFFLLDASHVGKVIWISIANRFSLVDEAQQNKFIFSIVSSTALIFILKSQITMVRKATRHTAWVSYFVQPISIVKQIVKDGNVKSSIWIVKTICSIELFTQSKAVWHGSRACSPDAPVLQVMQPYVPPGLLLACSTRSQMSEFKGKPERLSQPVVRVFDQMGRLSGRRRWQSSSLVITGIIDIRFYPS